MSHSFTSSVVTHEPRSWATRQIRRPRGLYFSQIARRSSAISPVIRHLRWTTPRALVRSPQTPHRGRLLRRRRAIFFHRRCNRGVLGKILKPEDLRRRDSPASGRAADLEHAPAEPAQGLGLRVRRGPYWPERP